MRQTAPDAAEIERRELRCQRLERSLENHNAELIQLERDIGRLMRPILVLPVSKYFASVYKICQAMVNSSSKQHDRRR